MVQARKYLKKSEVGMDIRDLLQNLSGPRTAQYAMWVVVLLMALGIVIAFLNSGLA